MTSTPSNVFAISEILELSKSRGIGVYRSCWPIAVGLRDIPTTEWPLFKSSTTVYEPVIPAGPITATFKDLLAAIFCGFSL